MMTTLRAAALVLGGWTTALGSAATAEESYPGKERPPLTTTTPKIIVVPEEQAKALPMLRMPTAEPVPLVIGVIWRCEEREIGNPFGSTTFEICDTLVMACDEDGGDCVAVD